MTREAGGGRDAAIAHSREALSSGRFLEVLGERVACRTESQEPARAPELRRYLAERMVPALEGLGCSCRLVEDIAGAPPFLIARRVEDRSARTVLLYGHGDSVRGMDERWRAGEGPWSLAREGGRLYGRGTADNKGQHSINLAALEAVLASRGRLGFNLTVLIEMGEEIGSPGLDELIAQERDALAADLLIASDGPRVAPERPTLFLGNRGGMTMRLAVDLREGAHHSGNWGGALANPAVMLAHALASIADARGAIRLPEWRPGTLTPAVRRALDGIEVGGGEGAPAVDPDWGEPGLTPAERLYGWNSFEILSLHAGTPEAPQNAIPGRAEAHAQLRFCVGTEPDAILPALRRHLEREGLAMVTVEQARHHVFNASRTDPDHADVRFAAASIERTTGKAPAILPNFGGSLPNHLFADALGLATIWVPHSHASCSQHAPDEHLLMPLIEEGMVLMTGLFWDLGEAA